MSNDKYQMTNGKCLLLPAPARQSPIIFFDCFSIPFRRRAFIMQPQVCAARLISLPAQLQFELPQRFDHAVLQLRGGLDVVRATNFSQPAQLIDCAVQIWPTRAAQLTSQVLRIVQALSQFGIHLPIVPGTISAAGTIPALTTVS